MAYKLGVGFTMVRKVGKLPGTVVSHDYDLEYGSDTLQVADGLVLRQPGGSDRRPAGDRRHGAGDGAADAQGRGGGGGGGVPGRADGAQGRARLDVPMTTLLGYEGG